MNSLGFGNGFEPTLNPHGRTVCKLGYCSNFICNYNSILFCNLYMHFFLIYYWLSGNTICSAAEKLLEMKNTDELHQPRVFCILRKIASFLSKLLIIRTLSDEVKNILTRPKLCILCIVCGFHNRPKSDFLRFLNRCYFSLIFFLLWIPQTNT